MIHVYGDSYTAPKGDWKIDHRPTWVDHLGKTLNTEVINLAQPGASTERAYKLMYLDHQQGKIGSGDVVIFTVSSAGRIHFEYINREKPGQAAILNNLDIIESGSKGKLFLKDRNWLQENIQHIKWWVANADFDLIHASYGAYVSWIKDQAYANKDITWVILYKEMPKYQFFNDHMPNNFIDFRYELDKISQAEIIEQVSYGKFTTYTDWDPRGNHFTNQNVEILVKQMAAAITQRDSSMLDANGFNRSCIGVIKNKTDYQNYIDSGTINYCQYIYETLADR